MDERSYATPEEAAMAEWLAYPEAKAFVVRVEYRSEDEAIVITDTEPSHPMQNHCFRTSEGWVYSGDNN